MEVYIAIVKLLPCDIVHIIMATEAEYSTSPAAMVESISEDASASLEKKPIQPSSPASSLFQKPNNEVEFNPGRRFYLAFAMLAVLTLMVALDG